MPQKRQFPSLQSYALDIVARNYYLYPQLTGLSDRVKQTIIEKSIDYCSDSLQNVLITAPHINQQKYWKACCQRNKKSFSSIKLQDHGFSYKIAFLQKIIQKMIQQSQIYQGKAQKAIQKTIRIIFPWIFNLQMKINCNDMKIDQILKYLTNVIHLRILLNLTGNLIDDEIFKFISPGLVLNTTLVQLNLSYNKIGNQAARRISKYLIKNSILTHLNLSNNIISYDGSRYLAQALKLNSTLQYLNLKLNSIDDKAGAKFFKDLTFNTNLKILDLQANLLSIMTIRKLCLYIQVPHSLRQIYVGNNNFTEKDFQILIDSLPNEKSKEIFQKSNHMEIKI